MRTTEAAAPRTGALSIGPSAPGRRLRLDEHLAMTALALMAVLPIVEIVGRRTLGHGLPGAASYVQHLTLWLAFLGASVAARQGRHLALATRTLLPPAVRRGAGFVPGAVMCAVTAVLTWAALQLVLAERVSTVTLAGGVPIAVALAIMPVGFAAILLSFWQQAAGSWPRHAGVALVVATALALGLVSDAVAEALRWPLIGLIVVATVLGAPIFVALGGAALVLFFASGVPVGAVPAETYRIVSSPTLATIPLFTLAGMLLAEGHTPARLVRLFRAVAGWLPGGTAVAAILVCAFFTTFTGASGVTILALGGLLLPVLLKEGYSLPFSIGALTAAGSIGLLFPPSLAVILYGVSARTPITDLFLAAVVPGVVLVGLMSAYAIREGWRSGARWGRPDLREIAMASWEAKWEVALPAVVLASIFGGFATLVEAAALTALYSLAIKVGVHRDVHWRGDLPRIMRESVVLVGGVLIIVGAALGLTSYMVDAQIPLRSAEWIRGGIESRFLFLLALNGFLLLAGCMMDIFSAIFVVVPLILPVAQAFDIDPLHLGTIFLVNLELGYLTPPVGMNLFLAAFRFQRPLLEVSRAVVPFLLVQLVAVALVTFLPALSLGVVRWLGGG
jgi:C4-dicarboxylate transporter, DctM subunit